MKPRTKSNPTRPCDRCATPAKRLYRVSADAGTTWTFVCDACWPTFKSSAATTYRYGGTWTSRRR